MILLNDAHTDSHDGFLTREQLDWLSSQLAHARQGGAAGQPATPDTRPLKAQIQAFQRANGLSADGQVGAATLMLLGRAGAAGASGAVSGQPEPRLHD